MGAVDRPPSRLFFRATGLALAIATVVLVATQYFGLRRDLAATLAAQARMIAENSAAALSFDEPASAHATLAALRAVPGVAAAIYRTNPIGAVPRLFARFEPLDRAGERFPVEALAPVSRWEDAHVEPIRVDGQQIGLVQVIAPLEPLYGRLMQYLVTVLAVATVAMSAAWGLLGRLRRRLDAAERELVRRATFDELTRLPNRNHFTDRIGQAIARAARARQSGRGMALLFIDLDNFKVVNDSLGHEAGDRLLRAAASRLRAAVRQSDTLCRFGGDEFIAIIEQCNEDATTAVAEHVIATLATPFHLGEREISIGASIGIALYPRDGADPMHLLRAADTALYAAKAAGRGTFRFFSETLNRRAHERMEMEAGLRLALARGELALHYQPQVRLPEGRIVAAEALLRWNSAELGAVPPTRFIPVAEECGLINEIGDWVIGAACRQLKEWRSRGLGHIVVAVNVSARQLQDRRFAEQLRRHLARHGVGANQLELEITESALMSDAQETLDNLEQLKALGVHLSLDDFGTGYSSFGQLKHLPFAKLKIDRSFVQHLPRGGDDRAIVAAILALARALELQVVAEGVETPEQQQALFGMGCTLVQGWLHAAAMPAEEFEDRLLRRGHGAVSGSTAAVPLH